MMHLLYPCPFPYQLFPVLPEEDVDLGSLIVDFCCPCHGPSILSSLAPPPSGLPGPQDEDVDPQPRDPPGGHPAVAGRRTHRGQQGGGTAHHHLIRE